MMYMHSEILICGALYVKFAVIENFWKMSNDIKRL